jgi:hypothetical protein
MEKEKTFRCCICGKTFNGYGNNPAPVKVSGRCCDRCNDIVISERIKGYMTKKHK